MGYVVYFSIRKGFFSDGNWEEHPRVLMKKDKLIELLNNPARYVVHSAKSVILEQFKESWKSSDYEDLTEEGVNE